MNTDIKIHFNVPPYVGDEIEYIKDAISTHKICGDGKYTKLCDEWMEKRYHAKKVLLTTSGSAALDMAALLCDIKSGDEVILPSFTFSSTANAFALRGAKLVFVDIRPDTMNIDENLIEKAISEKTKVIVAVHYAGVACEMDKIMEIAKKYHLLVVEDAAQAVEAQYKGKALGTIGDLGCFSFHETKNFSMGEGGALVINNDKYLELAEIYREKGTNRSAFFRGEISKYNWVEYGDSFLPSDLNAAYLWAQLLKVDEIQSSRMKIWNTYYDAFNLGEGGRSFELPKIPSGCLHNAHMFYIKYRNRTERDSYIQHMKEQGILCPFHYVPLHSAPAGEKYGRFDGEDRYTTSESEKLVRLPLYYGMSDEDIERVIRETISFAKC